MFKCPRLAAVDEQAPDVTFKCFDTRKIKLVGTLQRRRSLKHLRNDGETKLYIVLKAIILTT